VSAAAAEAASPWQPCRRRVPLLRAIVDSTRLPDLTTAAKLIDARCWFHHEITNAASGNITFEADSVENLLFFLFETSYYGSRYAAETAEKDKL